MWSKQFLAVSGKRDYKDVLEGNTSIPAKSETLDITTDAGKAKMAARKANDNAYHDLILSNKHLVAFNIVDKSVTNDLPDGDAALAWKDLKKKYDSKTPSTMVSLSEQYHNSKLENLKVDPEVWIVHLEILKTKLDQMGYTISEKQLMIHIMHHLPKEYETVVDDMEKTLNCNTNPLTLESMKERLHSKWEKINKNGEEDTYEDEDVQGEALFAKRQFKGRCRICGKIGHKGEDCYQNPNRKGYNAKFKGTPDGGFRGKCYYCKVYGHTSKNCPKRQSERDKKAYLAKKEAGQENDEISLFAMISPHAEDDCDTHSESSLPDLVDGDSHSEDNSNETVDSHEETSVSDGDSDTDEENYPWLVAEREMYELRRFHDEFEWNMAHVNSKKELVEDAMMAIASNEEDEESSSYDSWDEQSQRSDESRPFEDVVISSSESDPDNEVDMYHVGEFTLERVNTDSEESSHGYDSVTSLDPMPPPHRLCDFDLENRVRMNWEWSDADKLHFAERAKRMMMITDEDILRIDEDLSVYLNG